ncbi:MAG: DUF4426 domain-containing protein [Thiohalospira sp.]|uniref:DUF4426 domain-containing protein n=1 Tax=Thiohalospira sp. TaxID=3080549 RepID=UPI00397EC3CD
MFHLVRIATLALATSLALPAAAERSKEVGDWVIHYNAVATEDLDPSVADNYGITRSPNRGLVTVTVLRQDMGNPGKPHTARVKGTSANLSGQTRDLDLREVKEDKAIYYLDTFRIRDEETLEFELEVRPDGGDQTHEVSFRQEFFVD